MVERFSAGLFSVFAGCLLVACQSTAAEAEHELARLDANGDGFIAYQEAWADDRVERRFRMADADLSGRLDRAELAELLTAAARQRASRSGSE